MNTMKTMNSIKPEHKVKVLIGGISARACCLADYLKAKGMYVCCVDANPLSIQFQSLKRNYDAVIISHRTKYPKALCENLKSIDDPPCLLLLHSEDDRDYKISNSACEYFDDEISDPDDWDSVYRILIEKADKKRSEYIDFTENHTLTDKKYECKLHNKITEILTTLCVTPRYNGYNYIREAIKISVECGTSRGISKEIYPDIAAKLGVTPSAVERSIRTAIHRSWKKAEPSDKVEIFGTYALKKDWTPTNSEFIFIIADRLCCELNTIA